MNFLVCMYKPDNFAQSQQNFAQTHVRVSVTFRKYVTKGLSFGYSFLLIGSDKYWLLETKYSKVWKTLYFVNLIFQQKNKEYVQSYKELCRFSGNFYILFDCWSSPTERSGVKYFSSQVFFSFFFSFSFLRKLVLQHLLQLRFIIL